MAPNTMIKPCMVVNWLNSSGLKNCRRLEQLQTDAQRQNATDHQVAERKQQVQRANIFVIGRKNPPAPAAGGVAVVVVCVFMVSENCAHGDVLFD